MNSASSASSKKNVRLIPADPMISNKTGASSRRTLRVAAYCRVSTQEEEQLNSYEVQCRYYKERIESEPQWKLAGIYSDRGISGTSTKRREGFNKMIRACKRGSIDMIITKSISRFARNTEDCLKYIHKLKALNVAVLFEEQGFKSTDPNSELFITIHGSLAQSESENISKNVSFGMQQRAKEGRVSFNYTRFLGYRRGENDEPEIDPEQAEIVKRIYSRYLEGASLMEIAHELTVDGIPTPAGKAVWSNGTVKSILTNVRYKGDAILNKTFTTDFLTKKVRKNRGERPMYYVENNHPAIIDAETFARVQTEMAKRCGRCDNNRSDLKTSLGKHSGKYALTDLLVCGDCGSSYRRVEWTTTRGKIPVWRCVNRLNKNRTCFHSPTIHESALHEAIMEAVREAALSNPALLDQLKLHISMGLAEADSMDRGAEIRIRLAEIEARFNELLDNISSEESEEDFDDTAMRELMDEKHLLEEELAGINSVKTSASRIDDILTIVDGMRIPSLPFDDALVYQLIDTITVNAKDRITITFRSGAEVEQTIYDDDN